MAPRAQAFTENTVDLKKNPAILCKPSCVAWEKGELDEGGSFLFNCVLCLRVAKLLSQSGEVPATQVPLWTLSPSRSNISGYQVTWMGEVGRGEAHGPLARPQ